MCSFVYIALILLANLFVFSCNQRIASGTDARIEDFPFIVSLRYHKKHVCGSTILNHDWVLTSASCVYELNRWYLSIQYGLSNISNNNNFSIPILKKVIHDEYDPNVSNFPNDIAILKVAFPIPFGKAVRPILLPTQGVTVPENSKAVVMGWGRSSEDVSVMKNLQKLDVTILDQKACRKLYENFKPSLDGQIQFCALTLEDRKGVCDGDFGGPLIVDNIQIGIVSWVKRPCDQKNNSGVYTKVSNYIDWMHNSTGTFK